MTLYTDTSCLGMRVPLQNTRFHSCVEGIYISLSLGRQEIRCGMSGMLPLMRLLFFPEAMRRVVWLEIDIRKIGRVRSFEGYGTVAQILVCGRNTQTVEQAMSR